MSDTDLDSQPPRKPWFARSRRSPVMMLFRINRRPRRQLSLLDEDREDFFEDLLETLPFDEGHITGRAHQRVWRLSHRSIGELAEGRPALYGNLGFEREEQRTTGEYTPDQGWHDAVREVEEGAFAPFIVDGDSRVLAVGRHPEFDNPRTIANVFERLLNRAEDRRDFVQIDWAVEPILDETDFLVWLAKTPVVDKVRFVARKSNPDAIEGHAWVRQRLEELNAEQEIHEVSTKREAGLQNLEEDPTTQAYLESAEQGFAYVTAKGHTDRGRATNFDQRRQLAQAPLDGKPATLPGLIESMASTFVDWLRARREVGDDDG